MDLGESMNCFEWQNGSSDYLDGTLIGTQKREADEHLESCFRCQTRHKHFQQIISSLSELPRSALPIPIRKNPYKGLHNPFYSWVASHRGLNWENLPWYLRLLVEGAGLTLFILIAVMITPKIQSLYEKSTEQRVDQYIISDSLGEAENGDPPLERGLPVQVADHEDFNGENETHVEGELPAEEKTHPRAEGPSEVWRFNIKTDSPRDTRLKIIQALKDLQIFSHSQAGANGVEAPGGIQFNLLIPSESVASLKQILQQISISQKDGANLNESFSWFKNKSRQTYEKGKTKIVIWLSQI